MAPLGPLLMLAAGIAARVGLSPQVEEEARSVLSFAASPPSPDGRTIAVACEDGTVRLVDVGTRRQVRVLAEHEQPIRWIAWSSDGALLAVADEDGRVVPYDLAAGGCLTDFDVAAGGSEFSIRRQRRFEFQPGGNLLLVRLDPSSATTVRNVREGVQVPIADVPGQEVDHAAWGSDGSLLVCRGPKGVLVLDRDLREARTASTLLPARVGAIAPDGDRLVTSAGGLDVAVWNAELMTLTRSLTVTGDFMADGFGDFVSSARFSASGARLVTTTSTWATVACWDVSTGICLWKIDLGGGNPQLNDASFVLGDRRVLLRGYSDRILDAETGLTLAYTRMRRGASPLDVSSEGDFVLVRVGDTLEVWDGETLETQFTFVPLADGGWWVAEPAR